MSKGKHAVLPHGEKRTAKQSEGAGTNQIRGTAKGVVQKAEAAARNISGRVTGTLKNSQKR